MTKAKKEMKEEAKTVNEKLPVLTDEDLEQVNGGLKLEKYLESLAESERRRKLTDLSLPSDVEHYPDSFKKR